MNAQNDTTLGSDNWSSSMSSRPGSQRGTEAERHAEGPIARGLEKQTAKLPSDLFLWGAVGAIAASAILQFSGRKQTSNFVGQWAPTMLILGLYNKLVKVASSERTEQQGMSGQSRMQGVEGGTSAFATAAGGRS